MINIRFTARQLFAALCFLALAAIGIWAADSASAQGPKPTPPKPKKPTADAGTAFTYQGQLKKNGALLTSTCNFTFTLSADSGGAIPVGSPAVTTSVSVINGLFTARVNGGGEFGTSAFNGDARWLQTTVQCTGDGSATALSRQQLTPAPMAFALPGLYTTQNGTSPNIIGGYSGNVISNTVVGGTIGGGGVSGLENRVWGSYATVGGGYNNTAKDYATVGGGAGNTASGNVATVGGGVNNTASGGVATVGGGSVNTASGEAATVGGGYSNTASGVGAFIGGGGSDGVDNLGNVVSGAASTIGGGNGNNVSGSESTIGGGRANSAGGYRATISGGQVNIAGGDYSTVGGGAGNNASQGDSTIGGGQSNSASGIYAAVSGGLSNNASSYASIGGGSNNTASGYGSTVPGGRYAVASHRGEMAYANGRFSANGDAQTSTFVFRNTTTNTVTTTLYLDVSANLLTIAPNRTLTFDILVVARRDSGNESAGYHFRGVVKSDGGTTGFVGTPTKEVLGEDDASWDVIVSGDDATDSLLIQVIGAASKTIRWVATVRTAEVAW